MLMPQAVLSHAVHPKSDASPSSGDSCSQVEQEGQGGLLPAQQPVAKAKCLADCTQAAMGYLRDSPTLLAIATVCLLPHLPQLSDSVLVLHNVTKPTCG